MTNHRERILLKAMILLVVLALWPLQVMSHPQERQKSDHRMRTVYFISRSINDNEFEYAPIERSMFNILYSAVAPQIDLDMFKTTLARGLELIESEPNYCSYNIVKNEARSQAMVFSKFPSSIYPKRKLFYIDPSFSDIPANNTVAAISKNARIGLVSKAYFNVLSKDPSLNKDNFILINGMNKHQQLVQMLMKGRLDFIIEYQSIVDAFISDSDKKVYSRRLEDSQGNEMGYFVCSPTDEGRAVIEKINNLFLSKAFQQWIKDYHYTHFPADDARILLQIYQQQFGLPWLLDN
ncbi:hypothetical protein B1199_16360 [Pseudoalteromonas ulvae]|uniref:Solute-binding protein family 3/N-terminal domain-containing protein n=2 Tax=Pseudoalteromonas ulvae TaxID=107327 RepID=A0A244CMT1_PSEDV|nr:hypothetical protein B1199_16360 [Pseudoalteromonas ulvae]